MTLGNALRRVLLSSLQGAAVTSVQIDGVLHEFSVDRRRARGRHRHRPQHQGDRAAHARRGPQAHALRKTGPGEVTPATSQAVGDIEILNPDLRHLHLDEGAEIRMEFTADIGKGYVPAERNRPDDAPIGLIPVDSLYRRSRRSPTRSRTPARARSSTTTS